MLSIQPLESASGAADYYLAAFNYYAGDAMAMRWLGKGAQILALGDVVEKEQMLLLLQGVLPDGTVLQNKKGEHRPGFDMTFSAPKSMSILVGLGADPSLEKLHDHAVEKAVNWLEKEFAEARIVIDGKVNFVKTGNFITATFRQPSSRANDPALHTHCVTMNITLDNKGKARSLASDIHANRGVVEQIQRAIIYGGLIYRTEIANGLKERKYQLSETADGLFEIAGMPETVLRHFSQRRQEIESYLDSRDWEGARASSHAAIITRDNKEEHDISILKAGWLTRAEKLGFDAFAFVKEVLAPKEEHLNLFEDIEEKVFSAFFEREDLTAFKAKEAVDVAIETLSQKTSVFDKRKLMEFAMKHTLTSPDIITVEALDSEINKAIKQQTLYCAKEPLTDKTLLTTPWALTMETETLARIERNKEAVTPIANAKEVHDFQKNYESNAKFPLTPSQKQAFKQFLTTTDRINAIQGYAGTGKTTLLRLTNQFSQAQGFNVRGMAVTSSAANELRNKAGINAGVFQEVHQEILKSTKSLEKTIFIVDEASMLSTPQGHELIKLIEQKGARLYLVGDDAQLPSVKNGRIFGLTQEYGIKTTVMTDNIRQKNEALKSAISDVIDGELHDAFKKINEVRELKSHEDRIAYMAASYLAWSLSAREETLLFAPTHANRRDITTLIREGLKKEGNLGEEGITLTTLRSKSLEAKQLYFAQYYAKDDVIRFNVDAKRFGISKGDYLKVGEIKPEHRKNNTLQLINKDNESVQFRLNELPSYIASRAGFTRYLEVYKEEALELNKNDKILWTKNFKQDDIFNSERAKIKDIGASGITFILENGKEKTLNNTHEALKHIDYGYVLTNMKVQGKDNTRGIGLIESHNKFAATLRNFYVQITRGISHVTIITDDRTNLIKALEKNDDLNKNAIDYLSSTAISKHSDRFKGHPNAIDINKIITEKSLKDGVIQDKHQFLDDYKAAKDKEQHVHAARLAYSIIKEKSLYEHAKGIFVFGSDTYRKDALYYETFLRNKSLNTDEKSAFKSVSQYVYHTKLTSNAWQQYQVNATQKNKAKALLHSEKRNELAHLISSDINKYESHLKHYSIGKLNRLGLSQHNIQKQEEFALNKLQSLISHAKAHEVKIKIDDFFNPSTQTKEELGAFIKENAKVAHSYLMTLAQKNQKDASELWRCVNDAARSHIDTSFRKTLSPRAQLAFDEINDYKLKGRTLRVLTERYLTTEKTDAVTISALSKEITQLTHARNDIALRTQNNLDYDPAIQYFKINKEKLSKQSNVAYKKETVMSFANAKGDFGLRFKAAQSIAEDINGHYTHIKSFNIDLKRLNQYIRVINREGALNELNPQEKTAYKNLISYKVTSQKAAKAWKDLFSYKQNGQATPQDIRDKALELTSKRDCLAFTIKNADIPDKYLKLERVSREKLNIHASAHQQRASAINNLNQTKERLIKHVFHHKNEMNFNCSRGFEIQWDKYLSEASFIQASKALYQDTAKQISSGAGLLTNKEKALLSQYEIEIKHSPSNAKQLKQSNQHMDVIATTEVLMANPESTYKAIFGEPKEINSREMRYPQGLIVSLKGEKSGLWYDFQEGQGGSPIQAIMKVNNIKFKDALMLASKMAGTDKIFPTNVKIERKFLENDKSDELKTNKIKCAQSIYNGSTPIKNTLGAIYLKDVRHIQKPEELNVRFWPKGAKWLNINDKGELVEKVNKVPAVIIGAYNEKGDITGVQRIYLDEATGTKNKFMSNAKASKGIIKDSAGILQKGVKNGIVFIAEGPETGASIAMANKDATVLVSFGLSNIKNLNHVIKQSQPERVIIAADNDMNTSSNTYKLTQNACDLMNNSGLKTSILMPDALPNSKKTDWNDILKDKGIEHIKSKINSHLDTQNKLEIVSAYRNFNEPKVTMDLSILRINNDLKNSINVAINHEKNSNLVEDKSRVIKENNVLNANKNNDYIHKETLKNIEKEL